MKRIALIFMLIILSAPVFAGSSGTPRARALESELRCMACQGETIADSDADLAADMRAEVQRRIAAGQSDDQIKAYFVSRYGDEILMRPPVQTNTLLLWLAPVLALIAALGAALLYFRKGARR